ncbi:MAG: diversity-generating retroelement protein Avd [Burkholderiales bacterium]
MAANAREGRAHGPALEKTYQFLLWLIPTVEKFPRGQRFLLGDRLQATALDVLEDLIEATYSAHAEGPLRRVNLALEKMRFLCRLSKDLKYLSLDRYEFASRGLDEVGRLVGGWLKATRTRAVDAPDS